MVYDITTGRLVMTRRQSRRKKDVKATEAPRADEAQEASYEAPPPSGVPFDRDGLIIATRNGQAHGVPM